MLQKIICIPLSMKIHKTNANCWRTTEKVCLHVYWKTKHSRSFHTHYIVKTSPKINIMVIVQNLQTGM